MYTTKGRLCCFIANQQGFRNPALRRKAMSMEQIKTIGDLQTIGRFYHRIWGKSVTDFGKMSHGLWENEPPTLGK